MRYFTTFVLGVLITSQVVAQKYELADNDTIRYEKRMEKFFIKDHKLKSADLSFLLNRFRSSAVEYKNYQRLALPGALIGITAITAGVISFTRLKKDTHFFTPYTITLFVGDLIGIPIMIIAKKHLKRSVVNYNKEVLGKS